mmetsp:Transcript_26456/g.50707  ORF Transcript_26456/g.50707 Transcript_26456/m.50707 type:complete len:211 (-) Transcript_26456:7-639(-)
MLGRSRNVVRPAGRFRAVAAALLEERTRTSCRHVGHNLHFANQGCTQAQWKRWPPPHGSITTSSEPPALEDHNGCKQTAQSTFARAGPEATAWRDRSSSHACDGNAAEYILVPSPCAATASICKGLVTLLLCLRRLPPRHAAAVATAARRQLKPGLCSPVPFGGRCCRCASRRGSLLRHQGGGELPGGAPAAMAKTIVQESTALNRSSGA